MHFVRSVMVAAVVVFHAAMALAASNIQIPKISKAPRLEDFEDMKPHGAATQLRQIGGFTQQQPSDGKPATEKTNVYAGYDLNNLYVIWVCWDSPHAVRAHLTRREAVTPPDDDYIELTIDTFHDQRYGFLFDVNPLGMQWDALWTEGSGADYSHLEIDNTYILDRVLNGAARHAAFNNHIIRSKWELSVQSDLVAALHYAI